jgi:hypothetical protein
LSAGVDYAFNPHPSVSALKGAGVQFVARYISTSPANDTNGKNLMPAECKSLLGAGLKVCVVVEEGASFMLGGHPAGVSAAHHADAVTKALGMGGIPVYIAADFDAAPAQQPAINACLDGMASVIGRGRTGLYGGYYVVKRAFDAGKCRYGWQTVAWSGGQWDRRAQIRQGLSFSLGGASVDHDQANYDDYGQWPRPKAPAPPAAGLTQHLTDGKQTIGQIAASRSIPVGPWIDLQQKLHPADADNLVKDCVPKAGLKWWSVNP